MRRSLVLLAGLAAIVAACGGADTPGAADLAGTWVLTSSTTPDGPVDAPDDARVDLRFEDGRIGGTAACNSYFADVAVDGGSITVTGLGQTEMGCDEPRMRAEQTYLSALAQVTEVARDGRTLTLGGPGVELVFEQEPPEPDAALVGTTWHLDTLLQGDTASSVVGDPATLRLADDGTFSASTGCRSLTGSWTRDDGALGFADTVVEDVACPDTGDQDRQVVAVLSASAVSWEVEGTRLTLTDGDHGVGYTSKPS